MSQLPKDNVLDEMCAYVLSVGLGLFSRRNPRRRRLRETRKAVLLSFFPGIVYQHEADNKRVLICPIPHLFCKGQLLSDSS